MPVPARLRVLPLLIVLCQVSAPVIFITPLVLIVFSTDADHPLVLTVLSTDAGHLLVLTVFSTDAGHPLVPTVFSTDAGHPLVLTVFSTDAGHLLFLTVFSTDAGHPLVLTVFSTDAVLTAFSSATNLHLVLDAFSNATDCPLVLVIFSTATNLHLVLDTFSNASDCPLILVIFSTVLSCPLVLTAFSSATNLHLVLDAFSNTTDCPLVLVIFSTATNLHLVLDTFSNTTDCPLVLVIFSTATNLHLVLDAFSNATDCPLVLVIFSTATNLHLVLDTFSNASDCPLILVIFSTVLSCPLVLTAFSSATNLHLVLDAFSNTTDCPLVLVIFSTATNLHLVLDTFSNATDCPLVLVIFSTATNLHLVLDTFSNATDCPLVLVTFSAATNCRPVLTTFSLLLITPWPSPSLTGSAASGQMFDSLYNSWKQYEVECEEKVLKGPPAAGLVCNRTYDKYSCWPDAQPNTAVNVSCPWYLPWYNKVQHGFVYKRCGPDGQWATKVNGQPHRDARECEQDEKELAEQAWFAQVYEGFKIMYTIGYSMSVATLLLALSILVGFSKLHCMRNYIHMNLFASFIMRGVSVLVMDALLKALYDGHVNGEYMDAWLSSMAGCRVASVINQYATIANYYWLLVEGIYLHNLLVLVTFSERSYFALYLCIGWGAPVLFIIPWVAVKYTYENVLCWTLNINMRYWWILRSAVLLAILVNFLIFLRIIKILVSKMRAHQMRYTDYKLRLARSTLTLIPLLGIHEVVFVLITDEAAHGTLRLVKLFFDLFFTSFQGMLVAVLYCFVNKEVQSELLKKWKRWKLGKDIEEEYKHTNSQPPRVGNGSICEKHKLVDGCNNSAGQSRHSDSIWYHENGANSTTEHITLSERQNSFDYPESSSEHTV
ncbi:glucagon receptor [Gastrophryne carolinensis]